MQSEKTFQKHFYEDIDYWILKIGSVELTSLELLYQHSELITLTIHVATHTDFTPSPFNHNTITVL